MSFVNYVITCFWLIWVLIVYRSILTFFNLCWKQNVITHRSVRYNTCPHLIVQIITSLLFCWLRHKFDHNASRNEAGRAFYHERPISTRNSLLALSHTTCPSFLQIIMELWEIIPCVRYRFSRQTRFCSTVVPVPDHENFLFPKRAVIAIV